MSTPERRSGVRQLLGHLRKFAKHEQHEQHEHPGESVQHMPIPQF